MIAKAGTIRSMPHSRMASLAPGFSRFSVTLANYGELVLSYGQATVDKILIEAGSRLQRQLPYGSEVSAGKDKLVVVVADIELGSAEQEILRAYRDTYGQPINVSDHVLLAILEQPQRLSPEAIEPPSFSSRSYPKPDYEHDMAAAVMAFQAIADGRLLLFSQPVKSDEQVLYHECLARVLDESGYIHAPGSFIPAIERLGLTRVFDCQVATYVIEFLKATAEGSLGFNISALSAKSDFWWSSIAENLRQRPDIARRLIVEITETARPSDYTEMVEFIEEWKQLGCLVALDDFGSGFSSIELARRANVNIIKIDRSYVHRSTEGNATDRFLHHLMMLAKDLADEVVIEGIEGPVELEAARKAGAKWFQGYHLGVPAPLFHSPSGDEAPDDVSLCGLDDGARL